MVIRPGKHHKVIWEVHRAKHLIKKRQRSTLTNKLDIVVIFVIKTVLELKKKITPCTYQRNNGVNTEG